MRRATFICVALVLMVSFTTTIAASAPVKFTAGSSGVGDPYFPLDGNGGYDVQHYDLDVTYDPATDLLSGVATITAEATQNLSSFNFDFDGLTVRSITVDGVAAKWHRGRGELTVKPSSGIVDGSGFEVVVTYDGVPETLQEFGGSSGFIHTDDGAMVLGQPHVASTWFPANDHPSDKATFSFEITAPEGLEAISNGILEGQQTTDGWTTWSWGSSSPMVTYLAAMTIGEYDLREYTDGGLPFWDAIDVDLLGPLAIPLTGDQYLISQTADDAYKRLMRTIAVPAEGGELSFWVDRDTEPTYDFFFVEAHTAGSDADWTTLPDLNGHTTQELACPYLNDSHPFLDHYLTPTPGRAPCAPVGTTGEWWGASGASDGWEQWTVDLSPWSGSTVEVSLSYATDFVIQAHGVFVDDVEVSTGEGSTSFEADGDPLDGWVVAGAPPGSPGNDNDWIVGTVDDGQPSAGVLADLSLQRQGEILDFVEGLFGPYPFDAAGGVIDDAPFAFALEVQTRPFYSAGFFDGSTPNDSVVVHELAHQWVGDSLALARWSDIWLNEGFATYTEWLWSEEEGLGTAQEIFDFYNDDQVIPPDDPFWSVTIGDPGVNSLFDFAVYARGAMTLHQLRLAVGDADFFQILEEWTTSNAGGHVTTDDFIELAESISGEQLDDLFATWLFTSTKPGSTTVSAGVTSADRAVSVGGLPRLWEKGVR